MKLYGIPGTASLSPHIVLRELDLPFEMVRVGAKTKRTSDRTDLSAISPRGQVPLLELADGTRLTEGAVIVQYLADQHPEAGLAPLAGTLQRYRMLEWLSFTGSELHKHFTPLFITGTSDDLRRYCLDRLERAFEWIAGELADRDWAVGERFSIADAYLFTVLNWAQFTVLPLDRWSALLAYQARVAARPAVTAALRADGLIR